MVQDNVNVVYSTDSEEHRMNIGEPEEEFNTVGMYRDKNGVWCIKKN